MRFRLCAALWAGFFSVRIFAQCPPVFTYTLNGLQVAFDNQPDFSFPQATILWNFGDGNTVTNVNNPTHNYAAPGTYTVCMTTIWPGCNGGNPQTTCQTINVTGTSCMYDFTFTISGNTVTFNNTPDVQAPATLFWDFGDGGWFNSNDPTHFYLNPGTYTACMTITDPACSAQPIVVCHDIDASGADTCTLSMSYVVDGFTVQFFNTPVLPDSAITWDMGDGTLLTGNNPTYQYWFPATYYACVTASMPQCLTMPSQSACDSVHITVPDSCIFTFSYTANGLTVDFQAEPALQPPVVFYWDFGDLSGIVSGVNNPTHTFAAPGTYYVCLFADSLPCPDLPFWAHCEYITLGAPVNCTASFGYIINGLTVSFYHQPAIGSSAPFTLSWTFGDGGSASGDYPVHTYAQPGTYVVCLTYTHPLCPQPFTVCDTLVITGATYCEPLISHTINGLTVQFQNDPDYVLGPGLWFQWIFGDGQQVTGVNDPVHTYGGYGNYLPCFRIYDMHCSDTVQLCDTLKLLPTGLMERGSAQGWHIYPVPFQEILTVIPPAGFACRRIQLLDLSGREVAVLERETGDDATIVWTLPSLKPGLYLLRTVGSGPPFTCAVLNR